LNDPADHPPAGASPLALPATGISWGLCNHPGCDRYPAICRLNQSQPGDQINEVSFFSEKDITNPQSYEIKLGFGNNRKGISSRYPHSIQDQ
jgi:hypothetical protein